MAKQLKQYTRVSDINVGDAGVARGYSGAPTIPMLTYAAEELPVRVTSDTCDMYLVAAAKTEITKHMQSCAVDTHNKSFEPFYELPATSRMLKTRYRKHY